MLERYPTSARGIFVAKARPEATRCPRHPANRRLARRLAVGGLCQAEPVTKRAILLFAALGIAWGIPYLLIKIAVAELDPAIGGVRAQRDRRPPAAAARDLPQAGARRC